MKVKPLFLIAILGILFGLFSVYIYNQKIVSQAPVAINYNPYEQGIYASGIVESLQDSGSNVNMYPDVTGKVTQVYVKAGQTIKKGDPLLAIDNSIQLEIVAKDLAQVQYANTNEINLEKQLEKIRKSYLLDSKSVSINALDTAIYAVKMAEENIAAAKAQYLSDVALLDKYVMRSSIDGVVLSISSSVGDYISPLGSYDPYTQSTEPTVQMGVISPYMQVRAYVDEILVPNLPDPSKLEATMFIRGLNNKAIPLAFIAIKPYVIPNIELSDERNERVDVRVLPIIFKFKKPDNMSIYPGQLVDVYLKGTA